MFRAFAEVATQEARTAVWCANGKVGVPIRRIAELWLQCYWPILASDKFIPQSKAEAAGGKRVKFRSSLEALIRQFAGQGIHGGLTSWHLAWLSQKLEPGLAAQLQVVLRSIAETIRDGPVAYSGGALETGPVFRYDRTTRLILISAELWRELSLLGHWIGDAVIVRWAALTEQFAHRQGLTAVDVLPLMLVRPKAFRATSLARQAFQAAGVGRRTWSDKGLKPDFAVDHIIAFSLWGNNDLWNLVPSDPKTNLSKSDKLPAKALLLERRSELIDSWEVLRSDSPHAIDQHAQQLMGTPLAASGDWQSGLFSRMTEAVDLTALQRGVERWMPG